MLKILQISLLILIGIGIVFFSAWRYFRGGSWWIAVLTALFVYAAVLSGILWGDSTAWHKKVFRFFVDSIISTEPRAIISLFVVLAGIVFLGILMVKAWKGTDYLEVRVYDNYDSPEHFCTGARVTIFTRTSGLTYNEIVGKDGAAVFKSLKVPTTMTYQVELSKEDPPFRISNNGEIMDLPKLIPIDISDTNNRRELLPEIFLRLEKQAIKRPRGYLAGVIEKGDINLQIANAPWGVPTADIIINRLGYTLGFNLETKLPRWVAYAIGPSDIRIERPLDFRPDPAIDLDKQADISDYRGSGYDRGHMISPSDLAFKGPIAVNEAFYMSTITPQKPWINRGLWREIESRVRDEVNDRKQPAYIIAGPIFLKPKTDPDYQFETIGQGQIPIPTHFFRIIGIKHPDNRIEIISFLVPNKEMHSYKINDFLVTIAEIEDKSGLKFFLLLESSLSKKIKSKEGDLW